MRVMGISDEQLVPVDVPEPTPGPGQVLIQVAAAGVNRADLLQRKGLHPPPPGAPEWPGLEVSGTITAVGEGVSPTRVGEQVCALLDGGGYAPLALADAALTFPIPGSHPISGSHPFPGSQQSKSPSRGVLVAAASLPEALATVHSNLVGAAGLSPTDNQGKTVLIHGGSGGIGATAIQFLRATGAVVFATAGGAERVRRCEELGAYGIDYCTEDFGQVTQDATGGRGVDVILDVVGAAYIERNIAALAPHGHLAIIGMQKGTTGSINLGPVLRNWLTISGTVLRQRPLPEKQQIMAQVYDDMWPLVEQGLIQPVIDRVVPLAEAAAVHDALRAGEIFGKALLVPAAEE